MEGKMDNDYTGDSLYSHEVTVGAHTQGYRAFMAGRMLNENPYTLGTFNNSQWAQGWLECSAEQGEDAQ